MMSLVLSFPCHLHIMVKRRQQRSQRRYGHDVFSQRRWKVTSSLQDAHSPGGGYFFSVVMMVTISKAKAIVSCSAS